tara:strand:- start:45 stop:467 length:423 start_codon:yes stop_codon:yes gene_type:complete
MVNILFVTVKTIGIIYAVVLFSIIGLINAKILDYIFITDEDNDKYKKTTPIQNILTILKLTICVAILCFIGRNIVEHTPFILDKVQGFEYARIKEVKSGSILLFFSVLFSAAYHKVIKRIQRSHYTDSAVALSSTVAAVI